MKRWLAALALLLAGASITTHEGLAAESAVVLVYQRVGEADRHASSNVTLAQFEAHLALFSAQGYKVRALPDILAALDKGTKLPARTVALTFDNGFASVAREAWPRLKRLDFPFTVFIATDAIDAGEPGQLDWATLRALAKDGVTIGTRGAANRPLWRRSAQEQRADLEHAIARIETEIGQRPTLLAFPDGEYDASVQALAPALGFTAAFALASGPIHAGSNRFALPRFELSEAYAAPERVALITSSLPLPVNALEPNDIVVAKTLEAIAFTVDRSAGRLDELACYQSRVGPIAHELGPDRHVRIRLKVSFQSGHNNRINCTLPADDGRVRWLGLQYVVP